MQSVLLKDLHERIRRHPTTRGAAPINITDRCKYSPTSPVGCVFVLMPTHGALRVAGASAAVSGLMMKDAFVCLLPSTDYSHANENVH